MKTAKYRTIDVSELASEELHENVKAAEAAGNSFGLARVELEGKDYAELMLLTKTGFVVVATDADAPMVGTRFGATSMGNAVGRFLQTQAEME